MTHPDYVISAHMELHGLSKRYRGERTDINKVPQSDFVGSALFKRNLPSQFTVVVIGTRPLRNQKCLMSL